jgi:hypothetical protein
MFLIARHSQCFSARTAILLAEQMQASTIETWYLRDPTSGFESANQSY